MAEYTVTRYSHRYDEDIELLCHAFSHESLAEYGLSVSTDKLWRDIADQCQNHSFFLLTGGRVVGLIAGYITTAVTNDMPILQELMWYVYPEHRKHGLKLLQYFEDHGKQAGARAVIMALMHNSLYEKIARLYERKGYMPFETHYMKELK